MENTVFKTIEDDAVDGLSTVGEAVAGYGGAMGADTISKNGRDLKSHMSK